MPDVPAPAQLLTTWAARKSHLDTGHTVAHLNNDTAALTACGKAGIRAGERTARGPLEQIAIDALPLCGLCSRRSH